MPGTLAIGSKVVATSNLLSLTINTSDHPYFNEPPKLFQFCLPQKGYALGLEISEHYYYLLSFINKSKAGFPFYKHIPNDYRNNSWILSNNNIEPTSAENTIHVLRSCQHKKDNFTIIIFLVKRGPDPTKTCLD
eukprot:11214731-Ditylum_brightwellii.AAC.1